MLILNKLFASINKYPEKPAIKSRDYVVTYKQLGININKWADALNNFFLPNERRVAILLPNIPEYLEIYYSLLKIRKVPFLIDCNIGSQELSNIIKECDITSLITLRRQDFLSTYLENININLCSKVNVLSFCSDIIEHPIYELNIDTVTCRFTSGTNGRPKCLEFGESAIVNAAENWANSTLMDSSDRVLCMAAISNGLAFNTSILSVLATGAELHLFPGLQTVNNIVSYININKITRFVSFPTFYRLMVSSKLSFTISSVRLALSAGSYLWDDVRASFFDRFDLNIANYYGIAETGPVTYSMEITDFSLGTLLPDTCLKIDSVSNEVLVKTKSMCLGYLNHPGLFDSKLNSDNYYQTGDTGTYDNGRLYLIGRLDDLINVGGRKIDPDELIKAAFNIDGIIDAAPVVVRDSNGENNIVLVVSKVEGLDINSLKSKLNEQLSIYKRPTSIYCVENIPRNGIGKVMREQLLGKLNLS